MKKVSIIVPVYNAKKRLVQCLDSIISQTYSEIEVLLIDDGSEDGSGKICDEYSAKDSRFNVFHLKNGGVSSARNFALDHATGDYIQFLDSDDTLFPETISQKVMELEKQDCQMIVTAYNRENGAEKELVSYEISGLQKLEDYVCYFSKEEAHSYFFGVLWNKLYDAGIIRKNNIRFMHELSFAEDFVFNLEYMKHCKKVFIIQKPLYNYYFVSGTSSLSKNNSVFEKTWDIRCRILYSNYKNFFVEKGFYKEHRNLAQSYLFIAYSRSIYDLFLAGKSLWYVSKVIRNRRREPEIIEMTKTFIPYNKKQKMLMFFLKYKLDFPLAVLFRINHNNKERIKRKQNQSVK